MQVKIFERDTWDGDGWNLKKEFGTEEEPTEVLSITECAGNYIVILKNEDYFGKLIYVYAVDGHKIEIIPM